MKRYSIMVIEYGADREIELCQIGTNPQMAVEAAKEKTLMVYKEPGARRRSKTCKYNSIRIVDHHEKAEA